MNYYITYCDEKYLEHAEKLFELLRKHSIYKIIFFTLDFKYDTKFDNVIPIFHPTNTKNLIQKTFLKPQICKKALYLFPDSNLCFLDADILPLYNCDNIFNDFKITSYPLIARQCHDYIFYNNMDVDSKYEENLFNYLNAKFDKRTYLFRQTCVFLINYNCYNFITEWARISEDEYLIQNYKKFCPQYDETIANVLLWNKEFHDSLNRIHIDLPNFTEKNIFNFLYKITNADNEDALFDSFTRIPNKNDISKIKFLHGKTSNDIFDIIKSFNNYIKNN